MSTPSTPSAARTPLLRLLQHAFHAATAANAPGAPTPDALAEQLVAQSRRRFMARTAQAGVLLAAGSVLSACADLAEPVAPRGAATSAAQAAKSGQPRIVIVGGGMAGLNCAYQLQKAGLVAQVYEASNRLGGRIYTARNLMGQGLTTELGGEFIDSGHRDMLTLANEFGLPLYDVESASETALIKDAYFFNGRQYSLSEIISAFQPYAQQIGADCRSLPNVITYDNLTAAAARFDALSIADYFDSVGLTGLIRELLDVAYVTEFGRAISEQTAINFLWMFSADTHKGTFDIFGISDERYKVQGGNSRVIEELAQRLPGQYTLGHRLVAARRTAAGPYILTFEQPNGRRVEVTADYAVLTLPFTILRTLDLAGLTLPTWKTQAIQQLGYGNNAKLMLDFNGRPWRERGYTGYFFSDQITQGGWDSSQLQPTSQGTFTVYLGGQPAVDLGSGSAQSHVNEHLTVLEAAWPGTRGRYNGRVERFHWPTHPYTRASYACYRVGQYSTIAGAEIKPVGQLYFAGEHCSAWYQGYMNGAAETGRMAAEGIAAAIRTGSTAAVLRQRLRLRAEQLV
ncbi:flavin monoamine oxidase family protein [Hymenobacter pini]|uniref:flavin monoamine oxidase family protein n=1 Tax=Hymenobacter pini TaxID=2880879 RepID=UPI001CF1CFB0|nr:NAD(P)/FAD-dependent oxidoreductase [Hymenobacter pini]MCA8829778.1 NAD(P)/FAD-dependent oxidoreductase [Hymenobacter pini]